MSKKLPLVALIGVPNSGKSTLLNRLTGTKKAVTALEAHTTRDLNYGEDFWEGMYVRFVDTGGLVPDPSDQIQKEVQIKSWSGISSADLLIWVIDRKQDPETIPFSILQRVWKTGKPFIIAINKVDDPNLDRPLSEYAFMGPADFVNISCNIGYGLTDLMDKIVQNLVELGFSNSYEQEFEVTNKYKRRKDRLLKDVHKDGQGHYYVLRNEEGFFETVDEQLETTKTQLKSSKRNIKNIVFDLGGVLLQLRYKTTNRFLADCFNKKEGVDFENKDFWQKASLDGSVFETTEFWLDLVKRLNLKKVSFSSKRLDYVTSPSIVEKIKNAKTEQDLAKYLQQLYFSFTHLNEENVSFLKRQKLLGKKIYYFSNISETTLLPYQDLDIWQWFDGGLSGQDLEVPKPAVKAFKQLISEFDLAPGQTLYIDDVEKNLLGAQSLDFLTMLYDQDSNLHLDFKRVEDPDYTIPKVLFLGKPNVGKSTLFNAMVGQDIQIITEIAGTTLSVNDMMIQREEVEEFEYFIEDGKIISVASLQQEEEEKANQQNLDAKDIEDSDDSEPEYEDLDDEVELEEGFDDDGEELEALTDEEIKELEKELSEEIEEDKNGVDTTDGQTEIITEEDDQDLNDELDDTEIDDRDFYEKYATKDIQTIKLKNSRQYVLLDSAGIRKPGQRTMGAESFATYRTIQAAYDADVVCLVVDGSQGITRQDQVGAGIVKEAHKGLVVVVNKADLVTSKARNEFVKDFESKFNFLKINQFIWVSAKQALEQKLAVDPKLQKQTTDKINKDKAAEEPSDFNTKYLIFDYDGVFGDNWEVMLKAHCEYHNHSLEEAKKIAFDYFCTTEHSKKDEFNQAEMLKSKTAWHDFYMPMAMKEGKVFWDFVDQVKKLKNAKLAIVTSTDKQIILAQMGKTAKMFDLILDYKDSLSKEEKVKEVCDHWKIGVDEAHYFTDTISDVLELENFMDRSKIIGCSWGYLGFTKLKEVISKKQILKKPKEIFKLFKKADKYKVSNSSLNPVADLESIWHVIDDALAERETEIKHEQLRKLFNYLMKKKAPKKLRNKKKPILYDLVYTANKPPTFEILVKDRTTVHWSYVRFLENLIRQNFGFGNNEIVVKLTQIKKDRVIG